MRTRYTALSAPVERLSGGNQQKVLLARWLAVDPKLMILDDPLRGVDAATKVEVYQVFRDLAARGVTLLFLSTEIEELLVSCDLGRLPRGGGLANTGARGVVAGSGRRRDVYRTADGWLAIAQSTLAAIAELVGSEDLARLAKEKPKEAEDRDGINAWRDRVYPVVAEAIAGWKTDDAVSALFEAGVWSGPVHDYAAIREHPQFVSYFVTYDHPHAGTLTTTAPPIRFSTDPAPAITGAPKFGQHTSDILEDLGYSKADADALIAKMAAA